MDEAAGTTSRTSPTHVQPEDLFEFKLVGDVDVSPDGRRIAYVQQTASREENRLETRLRLIAGGADQAFTQHHTDRRPRFTPDGRRLAFLSKRSEQSQVWWLSATGGEAEQLTRIEGGVRDFAFAPDGRMLAVLADLDEKGLRPEQKPHRADDDNLFAKHTKDVRVVTELFYKADGAGFIHAKRAQVVLIPLEGDIPAPPERWRALTAWPYRHEAIAFSPNGRTLYVVADRSEAHDRNPHPQLWAFPIDGGEPQRLSPLALSVRQVAVSPGGRQVAFTAARHAGLGYENAGVYVVDVGSDADYGAGAAAGAGADRGAGRSAAAGSCRRLAENDDCTFANVALNDLPAPARGDLIWAPDGRSLFTLCSERGSVQLVQIDVETGAVSPLTAGEHVVYAFAAGPKAERFALAIAEPLNPGDIWELECSTGALKRLTAANEAILAERTWLAPERFEAQAEGGPVLDGWLLKPAGWEAGRRYPAVLQIHGGPMSMYANAFFLEFQCLAARGYAVIYCNPRGSQGYGEAFCTAIQERWGDLDRKDIEAALETALAQNSWIDPERLGVAGGSYGGYMTNWLIGHTDRFKAAVSGRCVSDWRGMVGSGDLTWNWMVRAGALPWAERDAWYDQQSPIAYAQRITTPLLLEAQEEDHRCPIAQSELVFALVKAYGRAPVRFVRYPGESHGMSRDGRPWQRVHRLREIAAWFARYNP